MRLTRLPSSIAIPKARVSAFHYRHLWQRPEAKDAMTWLCGRIRRGHYVAVLMVREWAALQAVQEMEPSPLRFLLSSVRQSSRRTTNG